MTESDWEEEKVLLHEKYQHDSKIIRDEIKLAVEATAAVIEQWPGIPIAKKERTTHLIQNVLLDIGNELLNKYRFITKIDFTRVSTEPKVYVRPDDPNLRKNNQVYIAILKKAIQKNRWTKAEKIPFSLKIVAPQQLYVEKEGVRVPLEETAPKPESQVQKRIKELEKLQRLAANSMHNFVAKVEGLRGLC